MGFGHRKLMDEPAVQPVNGTFSPQTINSTLSEVCETSCDPLINDTGYCFSPCLAVCPVNCRVAIPPPNYSPDPGYSPPPPYSKQRHLSPLLITTFVALSLAVLIVLGYVIYVRFYGPRRNRGGRNRAQLQRAVPPQDDEFVDDLGPVLDHPIWYIHTVGLQPSVISKIAVCKYKRGEGLIEGTECSVCLTEFEEDETLRLLPKCSHAFHVSCIDTWLRSHTNCPNCRAPIIAGTPGSPSPEPSTNNTWEEVRLDQGGDDVELARENIGTAPPSRGETEEETEEHSSNRHEPENEMQPIRRSVSVDSLSAAKINLAVAEFLMGKSMRKFDPESGDEENQDQRNKRIADSSSFSGSSSSMKRSLSWSGRFLALNYSRNRGSILPQ
ncbi:RING-H2 finger protein ATL54-like [Punica granatum]|uniref:RING-type E3 ubiquitin transferase n=1 Tax=Punica granatum TaxID=22663 RepID=A0A218XRV2_PUNGR|nr:RING-H2 finger protein ATL54-like [Punica granatum]OWM87737.1 hypothetical protein CDL15_Pgr016433 [Punica granatum]